MTPWRESTGRSKTGNPDILKSDTRATMRGLERSSALLSEASKLEAARNKFLRTRAGVQRHGLNCEVCRGSSNQRTETCKLTLQMKRHQRWHCGNHKLCRDRHCATSTCSNQTLRRTEQRWVAMRAPSNPGVPSQLYDTVTNATRESWKQSRRAMKAE